MKEWFARFPLREQLALLVLALVLVLYTAVFLMIRPLQEARQSLSERNQSFAEQLARVDALASELAALCARGGAGSSASRRNLTTLLNRTAGSFGLQISRLQPNSRGAVQVRFEGAPLEGLLRWLHELETGSGLILEELSISQTGTAGFVSASLRVAAGS